MRKERCIVMSRVAVVAVLCALLAVLGECGEDFYSILGVPRDADKRTIKKEYYRLARSWHPDKHPGDEKVEAKFKKISRAYEVLADEEQRQRYDQFGEEGLNPNNMGGGGFGGGGHRFHSNMHMEVDPEMFRSFFGGGGGFGSSGFDSGFGGFGSGGGFGGGGFGGGGGGFRREPPHQRVCHYNKICSESGCKLHKECKA